MCRGKMKKRIKRLVIPLFVLIFVCMINASAESAEEDDSANSWRYVNGKKIEIGVPVQADDEIDMFSMRPDESCSRGIDVSAHQGTIDWSQVKPNIDFAIIRCGYGKNITSQDDKQWQANVSACERLGIPYGVYLYSYAISTADAESEAQHVLRLLAGHRPTLPVFYDLEDNTISSGCSKTEILEHAKIFCNAMQNAGYKPGIYANKNWWVTYLTSSTYDQWERWVAQYNTTCTYSGNHNYWQYTDKGRVPGISGNVDMDYSKLTFGSTPVNPDGTEKIEYYPACGSSYTSLTDALKSIGVDASFSNRQKIAALNGISDYSGSAAQNIQLLNLLKQGKLIKSKITKPAPDEIRGSEMSSGYDRVLPDGDYMIASSGNLNYYLDIEGSVVPAANETNVSLCGPLSGEIPAHDIWTITYQDGFYRIAQKGADVSLDVRGADTLQETNVQVYASNDTSAQKWAISRNGRNGYRIQSKCSGYALDIAGGTIANGTNVRQYSSNDTDAQAWLFIPYRPAQTLSEGRYVLLSDMDRSMELDVEGDTGDIPNETNVQIWKNTAPSQYNSFDVVNLDNGYYKLIHAASGKALDLYNGGAGLQNNISLHDVNGNIAQEWAITDAGGGSYAVWSRCSGMVMDVENAQTANGTNVSQSTYHGGANQRWYFVKAEYSVKYDLLGGRGDFANQTKYYMSDLQLSTNVPEREGYIFKGWNTSSSLNGRFYLPGSIYSEDADIVLYAEWEKDPVPKLSLTWNNGNLVATVSNMDQVTGYGFVYGKGGDVTLSTPGRARIAYSEMDVANRSYSFNAAGLSGYTIRAYAVYRDENGDEKVAYSDSVVG